MRHFILSVCISTETYANLGNYIGILVARKIRPVSSAFYLSRRIF